MKCFARCRRTLRAGPRRAAGFAAICGLACAWLSACLAETIQISGRDYGRLSEWAAANHLDVRWIKREETIEAANRSTRLVFTVDSSDAEVNGVQVKLCFPAAHRNGAFYLSRLDLHTTLQPIVAPPRERPGAVIKSICLDPGHGGRDPGLSAGSHQEKKYTLLLAQELQKQLAQAGFKVAMTRNRDSTLDLPDRPAIAGKHGADLFVSLHFNSTGESRASVHGVEVYCLTPAGAPSSNSGGEGGASGASPGNRCNDKNMFLAYHMQKALVRDLDALDRGVHRARYAVLRDAAMPAVLIEAGFMSHPEEGKKIFDAGYRKQIARAVLEGIIAFKKGVEAG